MNKYKVVVTFEAIRKDGKPFGMSGSTQTFICVPGEPLIFRKPVELESLSFVIDEVRSEED